MATVFGSGSRRGSFAGRARDTYLNIFCERHAALRASFRMTTLDQRIAPLPQRWNVDVDPIIPPIYGSSVVTEVGALASRKRCAQLLDVNGFKNVIVVQNERLEERNQLDYFFEIAFLASERRTH